MNVQVLEKESHPKLPALMSIDLSRVYSLLREARDGGRASTGDHEAGEPKPSQALSLMRVPSQLVHTRGILLPPRTAKLHPLGHRPYWTKLRRLTTEMYRVLVRASNGGAAKDFEFEIPLGLPRFVNAATLKAMIGAGSRDVLFHKIGERWEICPDSYRVDLEDRGEIFQIGRLQIAS